MRIHLNSNLTSSQALHDGIHPQEDTGNLLNQISSGYVRAPTHFPPEPWPGAELSAIKRVRHGFFRLELQLNSSWFPRTLIALLALPSQIQRSWLLVPFSPHCSNKQGSPNTQGAPAIYGIPSWFHPMQRGVKYEKLPSMISQIRFFYGAAGVSTLPQLIWQHLCHSSSLSPIAQLLEFFIPAEPWSLCSPQHPTQPAQTFCSPNFSFCSFSFWTQQEPWDSGKVWNVLHFNPQFTNVFLVTRGCCHLNMESVSAFRPPGLAQPGISTDTKIFVCWATKASKTLMMDFSYNSVHLGPKCVCQRRSVSKYNFFFFLANRNFYF